MVLGIFSIPNLYSLNRFSLSLSLSFAVLQKKGWNKGSVLTGEHFQHRPKLCLETRKSAAAGTLSVELHENFSLLKGAV